MERRKRGVKGRRAYGTNTPLNVSQYFCLWLVFMVSVLFVFLLSVGGCTTETNTKDKDFINYISFSPDGKKILFDRRKGEGPYMIQVYDLENGELSAYQSPLNEQWSMARYSFDGKQIVFSVIPRLEKKLDLANMQLAIMDPAGKHVRKITSSSGPKIYPSFSHSGTRVIYARADAVRESGHTPAADFDIYEADIATGTENRLTKFRFFQVSPPYYLPDDKTFIFSGESFRSYPGVADSDFKALQRLREEYKSKYQENTIFLMRGKEKTLEPYIKFFHYSNNPLLSEDGELLFFQGNGEPETRGGWTQYYLHSLNGRHRRITYLKASTVWSGGVSSDGKWIGAVYNIGPKFEIRRIVIYSVQDGTRRDIELPDNPSRIINERK